MQPTPRQTFAEQAFSGFFLVCWVILALMLVAAVLAIAGVDAGVGKGVGLLLFVIVVSAIILLVVKFHPEQRQLRDLK